MLTRRRFTYILMSLALLGSGRSTRANAADSNVTENGVSLEGPLSRDVFRALVGQQFSLLLTHRPITLILRRVVDDPARPESGQFVVVFQGAPDLVLKDGTYRVTHATAGTTLLYLRPTKSDDRFSYFEAPFNVLPENTNVPPPPGRALRRFEQPLYTPRP